MVAGFCFAICDGKSVNLWCETWVSDLVNFLPLLAKEIVVDRHLNKVSDLINPHSHSWKEDFIRDIFEENSAQAILSINFLPTPQPDVPQWILNSKGTYSVKEAYLNANKNHFTATGNLHP